MPRSPCLAPECQDLRNELSRARHKISIMKKEIRHLEGMLETRDSNVSTTELNVVPHVCHLMLWLYLSLQQCIELLLIATYLSVICLIMLIYLDCSV